MALFEDILLTVDFDRTLTAPNGQIPERNMRAIEYFMANGGTFTVNTGRSVASFWKHLDAIPHNAPFLMYNGSAAYDNGTLSLLRPIDLDPWQVLSTIHTLFPDINLEVQGVKEHFLLDPHPMTVALYEHMQWRYSLLEKDSDLQPFIKFSMAGTPEKPVLSGLFGSTPEDIAKFDKIEQTLREMYADKVEIFRAAPRIIDVHAKGVSKIAAARALQARLGKKTLVCVGDAENDISMLDGADYAFCPCDGVVADRYENVCDCASGAVAEVIYKKIPAILGINLDIPE